VEQAGSTCGNPLRVGAVDDHPALLDGIRTTLERDGPQIVLLRAAGCVPELLAGPDGFDVVLLDLRLRDGSRPYDNVLQLRRHGCGVLVYTQGDDPALTRDALGAGALGVVLKSDPLDALAAAIRTVAAGDTVVSSELAGVLEGASRLPAALSDRERDVLRLYGSGLPAKSVARRLGITEDTAKHYLKRIRAKYAGLDRAAATKLDLYQRAVEDGVLPGEPPP
jgi:DNA-binding NarL/FixJ family response regulator